MRSLPVTKRLIGTGLPERERKALLAYIGSLSVPPSWTRPEADTRRELVARGHELFGSPEVGCSSCHDPASAYRDGKSHDVGSATARDFAPQGDALLVTVRGFDTPSLRFAARTAPYFHDGRYADLRALVDDPASAMGRSAVLSAGDRAALLAYLETL